MAKQKFFKGISLPLVVVLAATMLFRYTQVSQLIAKGKASTTVTITGPTRDDNMAMGNPSKATADSKNKDNYLMVKPQYAMSYNNSKGMANWVSWHLSTAWMGNADRCNCFATDEALPDGFYMVRSTNYTSTGFDRGHLCPSADRSANDEDNRATFLMSNMSAQAPILNEQVWEHLEAYCRKLATQGNELYILAGSHGTGGIGKKGYADSIADGKVVVPSHFWKIIVVLPVGDKDVTRITKTTRVIAVDMPNLQSVNAYDWDHYRTTVDALEAETGYDFLSTVPVSVQKVIEAAKDTAPLN